MKLKPQVVVIGLGRFGTSFASKMYQLGYDVMAIDHDEEKVQSLIGLVTYPVTADASSETALRELGVQDFDVGVVAIGSNVEVSVMVTVLLKTLDINTVISRASSTLHESTLTRLGCDRVIFAEEEMGGRLANTLFTPIVEEYLELSNNLGISRMQVPDRLIGFSLSEAGFDNKPGPQKLTVVSIKRGDSLVLYPSSDEILSENDELCIIGNNNSINKLL